MAYESAIDSGNFLLSSLPESLQRPSVAIVCGSGLGGLAEALHLEPRVEIAYGDIPNFPKATVVGHAGKLVFGLLGVAKFPAVLMVGSYYEGHDIDKVAFPMRVFKILGVQTIIVTNAAGGLNPDYSVGDVVLLSDHINLAGLVGTHPLRGPNSDKLGVRFLPLSDAYDLELRKLGHSAWKKLELPRKIHEGVYAFVGGPTYETRAESRMLQLLGADLVGMSTVPEVIVARHSGLRVLALSLVTNKAIKDPGPRGDDKELEEASSQDLTKIIEEGRASHEEVLEAGRKAALDLQHLVIQVVDDMSPKLRSSIETP
ncbi:MAG: hypothetical protein M1829_004504 [Trizodia sp. TS-e1964]|nr:MAG: hypothetical protein M1829_004504 [Trizodia sp. TS-e1964]